MNLYQNSAPHDKRALYRARLFGALRIFQQQETGEYTLVAPPASAAARNLLAYLLVKGNHPTQRLFLAGRFWPDASEASARRALRQAVWQIGQSLPSLVEANSSTLCIASNFSIEVDATTFEALATPYLNGKGDLQAAVQDLSRAAELYEGDFLMEFYDDWAIVERERLREMYFQVLERLISAFKSTSRDEQALHIALQLAGADPLRESAHREVMRLYHYLGRPKAALQQFESCRMILQRELGFEPDAETQELAQAIARRSQLVQTPYLPETRPAPEHNYLENVEMAALPLVGRAAERGELLRLFDPFYRGYGGIIFVEGEAGVGKTRLLQEAAHDAAWRGAQVLWGKAEKMGSGPAYGPLVEAISNGLSPLRVEQLCCLVQPLWLQVLSPIFPALANKAPELPPFYPLDGIYGQSRLVEALVQLLIAWAQITPLVLIIEDLQWLGEDTLDVSLHLASQMNQAGVLMIGSYRSEEMRCQTRLWEKLQNFNPHSLRGRLALNALDANASGKLIRASLGTRQPLPEFEAHLHAETGGNPFFILETLQTLYEEGQLAKDDDGKWHVDVKHLPQPLAVEQAITRRLENLMPEIRRVLNTAAVLGNHFEFTLFAALEIIDTQSLLVALNHLAQRHLLEATSQAYAFNHDKITQVVYEGIPADERMYLHTHIAQVLEANYPLRVDALAHHFTHGQVWPRALHYQKLAAEQARQANAYRAEAEHLSAALYAAEQIAAPVAEHFELLAKREAAFDTLGDRSAQEIDLEAMSRFAVGNPQRLGLLYQRQAALSIQYNRYNEAEATARKAVKLAKEHGDKLARAAGLSLLGNSLQQRGEPDRAIPYLREALDIYREQADLYQEAKTRAKLANALSFSHPKEAMAEAQCALVLHTQAGNLRDQAVVAGTLANIYLEQNEAETAKDYFERTIEIARSIGYRYEEARSLANLGNFFIGQSGQINAALQHYEQARCIFRSLGNRGAENLIRLNMASVRCNSLGENQVARIDAEASLAYALEVGDNYSKAGSLGILGFIARMEQDYPSARFHLQESLACALENGLDYQACMNYIYLVDLALAEDEPETALKYLDEAQPLCQETGFTIIETHLLALRGAVLLALNQPEKALEATSQAMARIKSGIDASCSISYRHFQVLSALGQVEEARAAIEQAYQLLMDEIASLTPEQRQNSLEHIYINRDILTDWKALQPQQNTLRLPRADAPTGRPLRDDEWVEIAWTLTAPEDENIRNKVERRRQRLLRLLREAAAQGAAPGYEQIAEALQVSQRTLAEDMATLRQEHADLPPTRQAVTKQR